MLGFNRLIGSIKDTWDEVCEKQDFPTLARGTVLRVELKAPGSMKFYHFGVYAGNKKVIHFSEGVVKKSSMYEFVEGNTDWVDGWVDVMKFNIDLPFSSEVSYKRAKSQLKRTDYNLLKSNCEHFATWCRTGQAVSAQAFGNETDVFDRSISGALINIPGVVSKFNNKLKMNKSRDIIIDNIVDI